MSELPYDIRHEILARLAVEPLLRFRCVCKSWKHLIDSHQFFKDHLNLSQKPNSNLNIVMKSYPNLYSAGFYIIAQPNNNYPIPSTLEEISNPLISAPSTKILSCCDGLVVLWVIDYKKGCGFVMRFPNIVLWNPSIRRFHTITVNGIELPGPSGIWFVVYGFGYDSVNNDYKLVRIVQSYEGKGKIGYESKMFSLKFDSWRRIPDFPYPFYISKNGGINSKGVFTNCALHWLVNTSTNDCIVAAFDIGTEEYRLVPVPEFKGVKFSMDVKVLGGCLTLVYSKKSMDGEVEIWVMKEYGVKESWSILLTVIGHYNFSFNVLTPIIYSDCGRKVLLKAVGHFMWYDIDKKPVDLKVFKIPQLLGGFDMHCCYKSLLLLNKNFKSYFDDKVTKSVY